MDIYSESELKSLINSKKITYSDGFIVLDDTISRKTFIKSLKSLIEDEDDFSEYKKESNGQKSRNKIRKK